MRIVIVGCGKVGYTLAERLDEEAHSVTVIDSDEAALMRAQENLDVMCIRGSGTSVNVLSDAGAEHADVVIAVTVSDESNMLCCATAKKLGAKYTVARIRDTEYAQEIHKLKGLLDINVVINPEQSTAYEILRLLRFPSAISVETFTRGKVELVGFKASPSDELGGLSLAQIKKKSGLPVLVCIVERDGEAIIPHGDFVVEGGDRVFMLGRMVDISRFFRSLGRSTSMAKNVMILGGSRIAYYLARDAAQMGIKPTVIEVNPEVSARFADELPEATVICGDGSDQDILEAENIREMDSFVALTGLDEENLMLSLFAIQCGVKQVIAKSNRQNYNAVAKELGLESVVSPRAVTANDILHFIRGLENSQGSAVETLYRLLDGRIEALEFRVHQGTRHLGEKIKAIPLRRGLLIAMILRGGRLIVPGGEDVLCAGDYVIVVTQHTGFIDLNEIFAD